MLTIKWTSVMLLGCIFLPALCHGKTVYDDDGSDAALIENKRPSFYAGSRYGRSQYIEPMDSSSNFQVAPRRDYHFLRYGKRSDDLEDTSRSTIKCYENIRGFVLTCSFTGIQDYYRCWKGQEIKTTPGEKFASNADN